MSRRYSPARYFAFIVLFLSVAPVLAGDAGREQAVTILKTWQRALDARPTRCSIEVDILARVNNVPGHAGACGYRTRILRDGPKLDMVCTPVFNNDPDSANPNKAVGRNFKTIVNGYYVQYAVPRTGKAGLAVFAPDGQNYFGRSIHALYGVEAFDGYACGDPKRLPELMLALPTLHLLADEKVSGHDCKVVEATSADYGKYTLYLDPSNDWLPRRIVNEKLSDNLSDGRKLKDWPFVTRGRHEVSPAVRVKGEYGNPETVKVDRWTMPNRCEYTETWEFQNGERCIKAYTCTVTKVDLHPSFDSAMAFVPQLQEGATLANQSDHSRPYRWKGGVPVPKSSEQR